MDMNRYKNVLLQGFDEMQTLLRYLYIEEKVTVNNSIDVPLELSMTETGRIICRNMNYPDFDPTDYTEHMDVETCMAIAEQLREKEPEMKKTMLKNRWEEIKTVVDFTISQNKLPFCISH